MTDARDFCGTFCPNGSWEVQPMGGKNVLSSSDLRNVLTHALRFDTMNVVLYAIYSELKAMIELLNEINVKACLFV